MQIYRTARGKIVAIKIEEMSERARLLWQNIQDSQELLKKP